MFHLKLYQKLIPIIRKITHSKYLIKIIFGLNIPSNIEVEFDMTTLLLRYCISKEIKKNKRVFEMGIGTGGLLSNFIGKRFKNRVYGVDISKKRVKQSQLVSELNNVKNSFICGDLFEKITDKYDYISFNPPYVPTQIGKKLKLDESEFRLAWDGGEDGMFLIDKFLEESYSYLKNNGKIIIGIQSLFIPREKIDNCISTKKITIVRIYKLPFLTSKVYILEKEK